uniref:Aldehyde dehydrogenase 1 family, member L2 n=1 Tax=Neogobius melanostomus TaxID=47308 RepID=A0A8C6SEH2_9GOBI
FGCSSPGLDEPQPEVGGRVEGAGLFGSERLLLRQRGERPLPQVCAVGENLLYPPLSSSPSHLLFILLLTVSPLLYPPPHRLSSSLSSSSPSLLFFILLLTVSPLLYPPPHHLSSSLSSSSPSRLLFILLTVSPPLYPPHRLSSSLSSSSPSLLLFILLLTISPPLYPPPHRLASSLSSSPSLLLFILLTVSPLFILLLTVSPPLYPPPHRLSSSLSSSSPSLPSLSSSSPSHLLFILLLTVSPLLYPPPHRLASSLSSSSPCRLLSPAHHVHRLQELGHLPQQRSLTARQPGAGRIHRWRRQFLKEDFELQLNRRLFWDSVLSASFWGGMLYPLGGQPSSIADRFYLGGPTSVRGFGMYSIGPQSEGDYLGGEAYWAGGLHLYTPLPFRPGRGGFGDLFRTHFFLNAGNLCNLDYGDGPKAHLQKLAECIAGPTEPGSSCGWGTSHDWSSTTVSHGRPERRTGYVTACSLEPGSVSSEFPPRLNLKRRNFSSAATRSRSRTSLLSTNLHPAYFQNKLKLAIIGQSLFGQEVYSNLRNRAIRWWVCHGPDKDGKQTHSVS